MKTEPQLKIEITQDHQHVIVTVGNLTKILTMGEWSEAIAKPVVLLRNIP